MKAGRFGSLKTTADYSLPMFVDVDFQVLDDLGRACILVRKARTLATTYLRFSSSH
jgi:hypothetical protein